MAKYQVDNLKKDLECTQAQIGNRWVCSRPINYRVDTITQRIAYAWGVLTGKYDALEWEGQ